MLFFIRLSLLSDMTLEEYLGPFSFLLPSDLFVLMSLRKMLNTTELRTEPDDSTLKFPLSHNLNVVISQMLYV